MPDSLSKRTYDKYQPASVPMGASKPKRKRKYASSDRGQASASTPAASTGGSSMAVGPAGSIFDQLESGKYKMPPTRSK